MVHPQDERWARPGRRSEEARSSQRMTSRNEVVTA